MTSETTTRPRISPLAAAILVIALAAFAAALCVNPARANDLFWQLRTGQWILLHHAAPHFDTYSWTHRGTPWVAHEWLAFVLFYTCYAWKSFAGVWLLTAGITAATVVLLYFLILNETSRASSEAGEGAPVTAALLTAFAAIMSSAFFQPRPQIFTYLFTLATLGIVMHVRRRVEAAESDQDAHTAARTLWVLPPLYMVWANLHAGVLVGLAIVGVFAAVDGIVCYAARNSISTPRRPWKMMSIVVLAGCAATLITPYGIHEYQNFAATISNTAMLDSVSEWASPNFHEPFGKLFELFVLLVLAGLFLTRLKHDPAELVLTALLAHEAITESRNVPIFAMIVAVLMARHLQSALIQALYGRARSSNGGSAPADSVFGPAPSLIVVLAVSIAICFSAVTRTASSLKAYAPETGSTLDRIALATIDYGSYPDRACAFIEREGFPRDLRMYNSYGDGGFLIWRMPDHPVFVDSRADVYFGSLFDEMKRLTDGSLTWRDVMNAHGVDMIVTPVSEAQSHGYFAAPDWALVYVDRADLDRNGSKYGERNNTFIFLRRKPEYAGLIARCRRDCPALAAGKLRPFDGYLSLQ